MTDLLTESSVIPIDYTVENTKLPLKAYLCFAGKPTLIPRASANPDPQTPFRDEPSVLPLRPAARASHNTHEQDPKQVVKGRPAGIPLPQRPSNHQTQAGQPILVLLVPEV